MIQAILHGHSFVEIKTNHWSILVDPFITWNPKCDISLEDVIKMDITAICLTHGHNDHVGDTIDIAQSSKCPVICMVELGAWLTDKWVNTCVEANIWWTVNQDRGSVLFVRADHSNSNPEGGYAWLAAGLIIKMEGKTIYHAGDTGYFSDMKLLEEHKIDLAFLPIGDKYTMGINGALKTANDIKAKTIVPIHYNTRPPIKADDMEFARQVMLYKYAVPKVLKAGQAVILE